MPYNYEEQKKFILTDEGQRTFLKVRDAANKLLQEAEAFKTFAPIKAAGITGDAWHMMAYIDRMVELGEIKEITEGQDVAGQNRVFVRR